MLLYLKIQRMFPQYNSQDFPFKTPPLTYQPKIKCRWDFAYISAACANDINMMKVLAHLH